MTETAEELDRIAICRDALRKFGVVGDDPRWSSHALDRTIASATAAPGGSVGDLLTAAFELLGSPGATITPVVANFIRDLVVGCHTRHREAYRAVDWPRLLGGINGDTTESQAYFAMLATPPEYLSPELAAVIRAKLTPTPFRDQLDAYLEP